MVNVLVTGGSGRLGKPFQEYVKNNNQRNHFTFPGRERLDVSNEESIRDFFNLKMMGDPNDFDVLVHMAALTRIPRCEEKRDLAYQINVEGTRLLCKYAKENGIKHFIYISTACVFPGDIQLISLATNSKTNETKKVLNKYMISNEDSIPYPKNWYAWTKLLGEEVVKSFNEPENNFITNVIRTNFAEMPWEYPKAFTDRFGTYLFDTGVVKGILDVIKIRPNLPIIHICGDKRISMYDYAKAGEDQGMFDVEPMTLKDYDEKGDLTVDMSITSKYWKLYNLEDSEPNGKG